MTDKTWEEDNVSAKLTDDEVDQIRTEYESTNVTQSELADEYGVDQSLISLIANGHRRA